MTFGIPTVNEIIKGQVFLGNLPAALSADQRTKLGVTHIVSVCPEYPSTGPSHLAIPIDDSEYEDILAHLSEACQFIQAALSGGGRVLVHCVMGISRSTTVVAAYLMKTRGMNRSDAIRFIKQKRPQVHPNYGFIKQLDIFNECQYKVGPAQPAYIRWKRDQKKNVTKFLNSVIDTTSIIPDQLLLSSDFPEDSEQAESLLLDFGITHLLSISPAQISAVDVLPQNDRFHIDVSAENRGSLLMALPGACTFIQDAIISGGLVLIHCPLESRACIVACAYLMTSRGISVDDAFAALEDELPLFNRTENCSKHLELFEACRYKPTAKNPLVREWVASEKLRGSAAATLANSYLQATTANIFSDTGIDVAAFDDALAAIQRELLSS